LLLNQDAELLKVLAASHCVAASLIGKIMVYFTIECSAQNFFIGYDFRIYLKILWCCLHIYTAYNEYILAYRLNIVHSVISEIFLQIDVHINHLNLYTCELIIQKRSLPLGISCQRLILTAVIERAFVSWKISERGS
jgi:hypothetical protein